METNQYNRLTTDGNVLDDIRKIIDESELE